MKKITSASLLIIGFLVGATALSAIAGTWTAPGTGCTPPNCNVDAPVTTGGGVTGNVYSQTKSGLLGLTDTIIKNLQVLTGEGTTTSTAGKVLTALDNEGTVGWRSGGGGGGSALDNLCTTIDTGIAFVGWKEIDLTIDGKNMCSDTNGCSYRAWRYNATEPQGVNLYGSNAFIIRQISDGRWVDSQNNNRGNNGNGTLEYFENGWDGIMRFADDSTAESSPDKFSVEDLSGANGVILTICDL